ncbi:hypothetical protein EV702DRAFT_1044807 [Suillus placidus]|uniref:Uncharacterized protein n=1 Tax=Suillus placidus TaxID=48579 RepID=A0A9P6ZX05_9AGAM|nr:hypothetical protein EV702DRAFT_1044807 [Suillus placidus]
MTYLTLVLSQIRIIQPVEVVSLIPEVDLGMRLSIWVVGITCWYRIEYSVKKLSGTKSPVGTGSELVVQEHLNQSYNDPRCQATAYDQKTGVPVMGYIPQNMDSVKDNQQFYLNQTKTCHENLKNLQCRWRISWHYDGETHIGFIMSSPIVIDTTNTVSVCGDIVFFEVDGVLPNWKTYSFKVSFHGPGTKYNFQTILFRLREGADPDSEVTICVETSETVKAETTEEDTSVKFEEEATVICDSEDVKIKLDGISAFHCAAMHSPSSNF